jgi:hypothetical protein
LKPQGNTAVHLCSEDWKFHALFALLPATHNQRNVAPPETRSSFQHAPETGVGCFVHHVHFAGSAKRFKTQRPKQTLPSERMNGGYDIH